MLNPTKTLKPVTLDHLQGLILYYISSRHNFTCFTWYIREVCKDVHLSCKSRRVAQKYHKLFLIRGRKCTGREILRKFDSFPCL